MRNYESDSGTIGPKECDPRFVCYLRRRPFHITNFKYQMTFYEVIFVIIIQTAIN